MQRKRLYTHILKNLFHEQAEEIVPLLFPRFQVEGAFEAEKLTAEVYFRRFTHLIKDDSTDE